MDESPDQLPAYLRIAALLRDEITSGRFPPGAKLPSETQLMMRHRISRSVAKWAIAVLKADGLADGRQGAGVFVRSPLRMVRNANAPWHGLEVEVVSTEQTQADHNLAARLAVTQGYALTRTVSRCLADGGQIQLMTSWRPVGALQQAADRLRETVVVRPASLGEINALGLPSRGSVVAITRTCFAAGKPYETADFVLRSDRCELYYELGE